VLQGAVGISLMLEMSPRLLGGVSVLSMNVAYCLWCNRGSHTLVIPRRQPKPDASVWSARASRQGFTVNNGIQDTRGLCFFCRRHLVRPGVKCSIRLRNPTFLLHDPNESRVLLVRVINLHPTIKYQPLFPVGRETCKANTEYIDR
jgi:hypothetical protein